MNTSIVISDYSEISFEAGWRELIAQFIHEVKGYHIRIDEITDFYSVLDITFSVIKTNREVAVWRAVSEARKQSRFICAHCGMDKCIRKSMYGTNIFCEKCLTNTRQSNKTGTWLDKC